MDVVFDPVGGEAFAESLRCIAPEGRLISIGFASGSIPQVPANIVLVKNFDVIGIYWGHYMGWGRLPSLPAWGARRRGASSCHFGSAFLVSRWAGQTSRRAPMRLLPLKSW